MIISASETRANEHYLRFGFGLDHPESTYFHDENCSAETNDYVRLLYGCNAPGNDGFPIIRSVGEFGNVPVVEFGIGYPSGKTRWELLIEYRPSFDFSGNSTWNTSVQVASSKNITSLAGMVAGYIDFKEVILFNDRKAVPFVGAGLGIARHRTNDFQIRFRTNTTTIPGAAKTNFAWMITAGLGFKLDEYQTLDLSWHYTDLGSVYTGSGIGQRHGNVEGDLRAEWYQLPTVAELKGHGIRLSLRIKI
ncbi:MAG: hypothetical protein OXM00_05825 [Paracoccaceae bacterium]|nr:hypothetical protein [Paracoccaceae bacterium]